MAEIGTRDELDSYPAEPPAAAPPAAPPPARIPTPWPVRWARFRHQVLPALTVGVCVMLTVVLWRRHVGSGNAIGEVETITVAVVSDVDGGLEPLPQRARQVEVYDRVTLGEVVARLDGSLLQARRDARVADLERLQRDLAALEAKGPAGASGAGASGAGGGGESLRAAIAAAEEDIAQLDLRLGALDVVAPVAGRVTKVLRRPGQLVQVGQPVLELVREDASYIISYLRQDQRIRPAPNSPVQVRVNDVPPRVFQAKVETVGANVEPVPDHQLRDPKIPEWGLPVRIVAPPGTKLRPGELVNLVFTSPPDT